MGSDRSGILAEPPRATAVVLVVTVLLTGLALASPQIAAALDRRPSAVVAGEWWRLITPILINTHGWVQFVSNTLGLAGVGAVVERQWGPRLWLVFYVAGGIAGEAAGLAWQPFGAGSSVAICGLLGSLSTFLLLAVGTGAARLGGIVILASGVLLTILRNLHGPPVVVGASLAAAAWLLRNRPRTARPEPHIRSLD
jgi:rhomboid protease GluP